LETLMALRDLAGDRVRVTLVAAEPDFVDLEVPLEITDAPPVGR
jgi:hypothetical protein